MSTHIQLNMSCTVAAANARRNSLRWPECAKATWRCNYWGELAPFRHTNVFVIDVPMLAPITIGIAGCTSRTANCSIVVTVFESCQKNKRALKENDLLSPATMLTTMLVEVDDDWRRTVTSTPIMRPQNGLFSSLLLLRALPVHHMAPLHNRTQMLINLQPCHQECETHWREGQASRRKCTAEQ